MKFPYRVVYIPTKEKKTKQQQQLQKRLFTLSYSCIAEKNVVFGLNFRNRNFDRFTCFEVPKIRKSHLYNGWFVCPCISLCVCLPVISIS